MPLYDYRCPDCGMEFTELVSFAKRHEVQCPDCGSNAQQQASSFAVGALRGGSGGGGAPAGSPFS